MQRIRMGIALTLAAVAAAPLGCGGNSAGPLDGVDAIVFLQRPKRNEIVRFHGCLPSQAVLVVEKREHRVTARSRNRIWSQTNSPG